MGEPTPGPWTKQKGPIEGRPTWTITAKSPRSGHGRVYGIATIDINPEDEANARLIAAALQLKAALEALETAELAHANCPECNGEGVPELCELCFPAFDDARVSRRAALLAANGGAAP